LVLVRVSAGVVHDDPRRLDARRQFVWTFSHFSLSASLVIVGASIGRFVANDFDTGVAPKALRWYLGGGLAIVLGQYGTLGFCHHSLDDPSSTLIPRWLRIRMRHAAALVCALVPLAPELVGPTRTLAVYAGIVGAVLLVEVFGKLGAWAHDDAGLEGDEKEVRAACRAGRSTSDVHHRAKRSTFSGRRWMFYERSRCM
jgi:hypothetical protein